MAERRPIQAIVQVVTSRVAHCSPLMSHASL